ncbi:sigma-70 family RNA polymerase sigma factor [Embleya sp. MST-111070]|uniref:sigma-70 family RNA polymerase sigma factor n=1 Tax=Embleya sp. MST-111070 TaxID=3398231 RepID=UPI003F73F0D6
MTRETHGNAENGARESAAREFEAHRPRLFAVGYRLLGSASEAEDAVQDAYLRGRSDHDAVREPAAWLTKVLTDICLNRLSSARARRELYVGPWLPEPARTDRGDYVLGVLETAEQRESVSLAMLTLMEELTPAERAVFVLRGPFGHSHREIADILDVREEHSRQPHRRARLRLGEPRGRYPVDAGSRWRALTPRWNRVAVGPARPATALSYPLDRLDPAPPGSTRPQLLDRLARSPARPGPARLRWPTGWLAFVSVSGLACAPQRARRRPPPRRRRHPSGRRWRAGVGGVGLACCVGHRSLGWGVTRVVG